MNATQSLASLLAEAWFGSRRATFWLSLVAVLPLAAALSLGNPPFPREASLVYTLPVLASAILGAESITAWKKRQDTFSGKVFTGQVLLAIAIWAALHASLAAALETMAVIAGFVVALGPS